jgi:hypothetical protein
MGREDSVIMGSDGAIYHAPCRQSLAYHGVRGQRDVDFYCPGCVQHVTLPMHRLAAIPMGAPQRIGLFTSGAVGIEPRA